MCFDKMFKRVRENIRGLLQNDASHDNIYMPRVMVIRPVVGIIYMQVCAISYATDREILEVCNAAEYPSGTVNGWSVVMRDGEPEDGGPIRCDMHPDRVHFLISC